MSANTPALARYALPPLAAAGVVLAVCFVFRHTLISRHSDGWVLVGIGAVYVLAALTVLVFTRRWDLRSLGQVMTYLGDAGLYGVSGAARFGWRAPLSAWETDLVRALFVVGGASLTVGILIWGIRTKGGTREPGWNGSERRRIPWGRRWTDKRGRMA